MPYVWYTIYIAAIRRSTIAFEKLLPRVWPMIVRGYDTNLQVDAIMEHAWQSNTVWFCTLTDRIKRYADRISVTCYATVSMFDNVIETTQRPIPGWVGFKT